MLRVMLLASVCFFTLTAPLLAETREEKVRADKKKVEGEGFWIYNDLPKAFEAARSNVHIGCALTFSANAKCK